MVHKWAVFLLGALVGGLCAGYFITWPDQKISDANRFFQTMRVSILTETLVDTCFFADVDPEALQRRLKPLGYHQIGGSSEGSASFIGGVGGRIFYGTSQSGPVCSATLNDAAEPDRHELCQTAIILHRRLRVYLRQAQLAGRIDTYNLRNVRGLGSVQTYEETCAGSEVASPPFLWNLTWQDQRYEISLSPVSQVKRPWLSYGGFSRAPGYELSMRSMSES